MFEMTIAVLLVASGNIYIFLIYLLGHVSPLVSGRSRFNADSCLRLKFRQSRNPRPPPLPLDKDCDLIVGVCWGHYVTTPRLTEFRRMDVTSETCSLLSPWKNVSCKATSPPPIHVGRVISKAIWG